MVFKSLILSTLYSGLETMVTSPGEYIRMDVCILGFGQETHAVNGHIKNCHRCRQINPHSSGTRAMAVGGLVSVCDRTSHCSPGSRSTCAKQSVWLQGLHCCTVWQAPFYEPHSTTSDEKVMRAHETLGSAVLARHSRSQRG